MYLKYIDDDTDSQASHTANTEAFIENILNTAKIRGKTYLNADCSQIKIIPDETYGGDHFLIVSINEDLHVSVLDHSLPDLNGKLFNFIGNLESYASKFFEYLDQMDEFYGNMNTIDELCFVVDPVNVTTKSNYRVIKLDDKVYMKIVVDPLLPSSITTNFYGPTVSVESYRESYRKSINDWNPDDDIYRNFLRMFEIVAFPQKSNDQKESEEGYCSICYLYRLDGHLPIITCDNSKCSLVYHTMCLKEWFSSLSNSKTFLNVTSGSCPSCKEKLSASFAQLINI